jgi:hypothetical protein
MGQDSRRPRAFRCRPGIRAQRWRKVEIEARDGDIIIRRSAAHVRARIEAEAAADEIIAESRRHSLGGVSVRELLDEGRRE